MATAAEALRDYQARRSQWTKARLKLGLVAVGIAAFYTVSLTLVHFDLGKLAIGLPKLGRWLVSA